MDTIFALASGRGKAGVAVIRISGRGAWPAVQSLAGDLPVPRRASLRRLRDRSGQELDQALVVLFPAGASFTGEDVAELQLHGSPAVVAAVSEALAAEPDLRPAEPGEFTRRALQNGRLDLAQVEGLADLINAETEAQRLQAQRLFDGALGERVMAWRASLLRASSLIVAAVDFAEEDVPQDVRAACAAEISGVRDALVAEQEGAFFAERVRDGFEIAIVGPPNAGKSTLLNYLAGREAALTSEQAGTTRDVIEVRMDLGGLPVTLLDMAGLRETEDAVEAAGVGGGRGAGAGGGGGGVGGPGGGGGGGGGGRAPGRPPRLPIFGSFCCLPIRSPAGCFGTATYGCVARPIFSPWTAKLTRRSACRCRAERVWESTHCWSASRSRWSCARRDRACSTARVTGAASKRPGLHWDQRLGRSRWRTRPMSWLQRICAGRSGHLRV
jgi:uncharacterized membrane protein YgcG